MARRNLTLISVVVALTGFLYAWLRGSPPTTTPPDIAHLPGRNNTALFLTNSEHGLRNAILATVHSLLVSHPHVEVHVAGFANLEPRIDEIVSFASRHNPAAHVTFHVLPGESYGDLIFTGNRTITALIHPPGFRGAWEFGRTVSMFFMPWSGPDYLAIHQRVGEVMEEIDPAIVAVDPALFPAVQASKTSGRKYLILSTNSVRENAPHEQGAAMLWKFPA